MGQMFSAFRHPRDAVKCLRGPKASNDCSGHTTHSLPPPIDQRETTTHETLKTSENTVNISPQPNEITTSSQHGGLPISSRPVNRITRRPSYKGCGPSGSDEDLILSSSGTTEQAKMVPQRIGLPSLPPEIIHIITRYLPPSGLMSLSYSCRVIRDKSNASIEHSLGTKIKTAQLSPFALGDNLPPRRSRDRRGRTQSRPTTVRNIYHTERLKLLCMLDRDQSIPPSKAVCSNCADTHDRSLFSDVSLAQSSCERLCIGSAGHVWICPHWIFDYNLVNISKNPLGNHSCGIRNVCMSALKVQTTQPTVMWPIFLLDGKHETPSRELVANFLAQTEAIVCKHLHFSDEFLLNLYSPDCKKLRAVLSICQCSTCVWQLSQPNLAGQLSPPNARGSLSLRFLTGGKCDFCGTAVCFRIFEESDGREMLYLVVHRRIRNFQGCTDRAWIDQVTDPGEFEGLERKWTAASNREVETVQHRVLMEYLCLETT